MPISRLPRIAAVFVLILLGFPAAVIAQLGLRPPEGPPEDPDVRQAEKALQRFVAAADLRYLVVPDGPDPLSRLLSSLRLLDAHLALPGAFESLRASLPGLQDQGEDAWRDLRLEVHRALRIAETVAWADTRQGEVRDAAAWGPEIRTREVQRAIRTLERLASWVAEDEPPNILAASAVRTQTQPGVAVGSISGTVTDVATGEPLVNIFVEAVSTRLIFGDSARTDKDGSYHLAVSADEYFLRSIDLDQHFINELYDDHVCLGTCLLTPGDTVLVDEGAEVTGVDFALDLGGSIRGSTVDARTGLPLPAFVWIFSPAGERVSSSGSLVPEASFRAGGLPTGQYFARAATGDFIPEVFEDFPCPFLATCDVSGGTPIAVTAGVETTGIQFSLEEGGTISGIVTEESTGAPADGEVQLFDPEGTFLRATYIDSAGAYTLHALPAGTYFARAPMFRFFADELYQDIPCPFGCNIETGTPIRVVAGQDTSQIDFEVTLAGTLSGRILDRSGQPQGNGLPIALFDSAGSFLEFDLTFFNGWYSFVGLPPGDYFVGTATYPLFADELFDDLPCSLTACNPLAADPISVVGGVSTDDLHFILDPPGACGNGIADEVTLSDHTWTVPVTYEACDTLTMGNGTQIFAGGDVTLKAGQTVVLEDGFSVGVGGALTVVITPVLASTP